MAYELNPFPWAAGEVRAPTTKSGTIDVIDADGVVQARFKATTGNLRVSMDFDAKTNKPTKWRDAVEVWAAMPKWVRVQVTGIVGG